MTTEDVTVIIRSTGERTLDLCKSSIEDQLPLKNIFVIEEKPFAEAVKKTLQIGIEENRKWTLAVDADVLLGKDCIVTMVENAEKLADDLYFYQGYIVDKFYRTPREGGPHLYRTRYMALALDLLKNNLNDLRPESSTNLELTKKGYKIVVDNRIYALHDFWQFYIDVYRKAFFHAHKHFDVFTIGSFIQHWKTKMNEDVDYKIAMFGYFDGINSNEAIKVDIDYFKEISRDIYTQLAVKEKKPIASKDFKELKNCIETIIFANSTHELLKKELPEPKPTIGIKVKRMLYQVAKKIIK